MKVDPLNHRLFVPRHVASPSAGAPLVVALHGASQTASDFAAGTQFDAAAESLGAYVLYPEQSLAANALRAWNWFLPENQSRTSGEPAAILNLVDATCNLYPIDRAKIFVAGLSAGGAMAAILAEQAPDVFAAAGIVAGVPLHASHDVITGYAAMHGNTMGNIAPVAVRNARQSRSYADLRVTIWTGLNDNVVAPSNARLIARQFRALLNVGDRKKTLERHSEAVIARWRDRSGRVRVELWQVPAMGHAWSGGSFRGSHTFPSGPSATGEMMGFFLPDAAEHIEGIGVRATQA